MSRQLGLENKLDDYWDERTSINNCSYYFENYLLPNIEPSVVLGLDGLDRIFHSPAVSKEVQAMLRSWHERAKSSESWQKLRLVITHATEVYVTLEEKK